LASIGETLGNAKLWHRFLEIGLQTTEHISNKTKIMEASSTVGDACAGIVPVTPAAGVKRETRVVTPEDAVVLFGGVTPRGGSPPPQPLPVAPVEAQAVVPATGGQRFHQPGADLERNNKRRKTAFTIDLDDKALTDRNIIIPLDKLIKFIETNFVCKRCRKRLDTCNPVETKPKLGFEIFGLACGLNFECGCGAEDRLRPSVVSESQSKVETLANGKPFQNRLNSADFEINRRFHLGLQLCGSGGHDGAVIAGMLKINVNPMQKQWTRLQETLAKAIIKVGTEVLDENLYIECQFNPKGEDGRYTLEVASDTRWDKRGSTRRYNSLSGCSVAFGLRAKLPIGIETMSSVCIKCTKGILHDADVCPKNYQGSSKGMEVTGAAAIVKRLFENVYHKCYVANLVTDDDSSVRNFLTHSYREQLEAAIITEAEWPRYANGKKKPDNGLLPLLHAIIRFKADKGHRVRGYSHFLFAEAVKSIANGCGCTKVDAERMKRQLSWTLRLHCFGTYEEFQTAVLAVLEHHFNNHQYCGDWCQASKVAGAEEVSAAGLRFRCKERNKELYLVLKKHHEEFMEESKLRQLFHRYDTNTVEGFNKFLTKFLPKDRTYCQTIENQARTMLAVSLQSIGYRQFYQRVFALTGMNLEEDGITNIFLRSEDSEKLWRTIHCGKESVKRTRMRTLYQKLRNGRLKLTADNALCYQTGMMGPGGDEGEHGRQPRIDRIPEEQVGSVPPT
jgi:hypothetical protein